MLVYNDEFFGSQEKGSLASARRAVPIVLEYVQPKSVIDVGCGVATWAAMFKEAGVAEVFGVDGDYVDRGKLHIAADHFMARDLTRPLELGRTFDMAVCLEVGEHLPAEKARTLADSLAELAPVILFSAAVPFQGGNDHVNEQWPGYWADLFKRHGFVAVDCLRRRLWQQPGVQWWYAQNMFFLVKREMLEQLPKLKAEYDSGCRDPLPLVHPERFEALFLQTDIERMSFRTAFRICRTVLGKAIRRRLHRRERDPRPRAEVSLSRQP